MVVDRHLPAADLGRAAVVADGPLWFVATSVGTSVGGQIGKFTADNPTNTFIVCAVITIAIGAVLAIFSKRIAKLMHHVH